MQTRGDGQHVAVESEGDTRGIFASTRHLLRVLRQSRGEGQNVEVACPHHNRKRMTSVSTVLLQSSLAEDTRHTELIAVRERRKLSVERSLDFFSVQGQPRENS